MQTVDVGIGHDDDLVIPEPADIEVPLSDARSKRRDDDFDFLILKHLVQAGLFDIQDLAAQGEESPGFSGPGPVLPIRRHNHLPQGIFRCGPDPFLGSPRVYPGGNSLPGRFSCV